jgi:hypothetical protein
MQALQSLQLETPTVDDVLLKALAFVIEDATERPRYIDVGEVALHLSAIAGRNLLWETSKESLESIDDNWRYVFSHTSWPH